MSEESLLYTVREIIAYDYGCCDRLSCEEDEDRDYCACLETAERIVALVTTAAAAGEREACAQLVDRVHEPLNSRHAEAAVIAAAIRARGISA